MLELRFKMLNITFQRVVADRTYVSVRFDMYSCQNDRRMIKLLVKSCGIIGEKKKRLHLSDQSFTSLYVSILCYLIFLFKISTRSKEMGSTICKTDLEI